MVAVHMQVDQVRSIVRGAVPGASVTVGGDLAVMRDEMASSEGDLIRGELIALPILLWRSCSSFAAGARRCSPWPERSPRSPAHC